MKIKIICDEEAVNYAKQRIDEVHPKLVKEAKVKNAWLMSGCVLLYPVSCLALYFLWVNVLNLLQTDYWAFPAACWTGLCWLVGPFVLIHSCRMLYRNFKNNGPEEEAEWYRRSLKYLTSTRNKHLLDAKINSNVVTLYLEDPATHQVTTEAFGGFTVTMRTDIQDTTVDMVNGTIEMPFRAHTAEGGEANHG